MRIVRKNLCLSEIFRLHVDYYPRTTNMAHSAGLERKDVETLQGLDVLILKSPTVGPPDMSASFACQVQTPS